MATHAEHSDSIGRQGSNCAGITAAPSLDDQSADDRYATLGVYSDRSAVNPGSVLFIVDSSRS
jgi:hypothetical protein